MRAKYCSKCKQLHNRVNQRYCKYCHNEYMRENRLKHSELQKEARKKANARSYANVYLKRGKLNKQTCKICGEKAQMHHEDYVKPLEVEWLCRNHHLELHMKAPSGGVYTATVE